MSIKRPPTFVNLNNCMVKIVCFYWNIGSGGDTILRMLENKENYLTTHDRYYFDEKLGRTFPIKNRLFDFIEGGTREHNWTEKHLDSLIKLQNTQDRIVVIPTHKLQTVDFFKKSLENECITMGITYNKNLWPFVLKNQVNKLFKNNQSFEKIYSNNLHKKIKSKNLFDWLIMSERLRHNENTIESIEYKFEKTIHLDDMLNGKIELDDILSTPNNQKIYNLWLESQDKLYRFAYQSSIKIKNILGYNPKCSDAIDPKVVMLSNLDKSLLNFHFKITQKIQWNQIKTLDDLNKKIN